MLAAMQWQNPSDIIILIIVAFGNLLGDSDSESSVVE